MTAKSFFDGLKAALPPLFLAVMTCLNFYAFTTGKISGTHQLQTYTSSLEQTSAAIAEIRKLVDEMPSVVSNYVDSAVSRMVSSEPSPRPESKFASSVVPSFETIRYQYMVVDGYPAFRYYGRNFSIGSPFWLPGLRVSFIWPDRLVLSDGTILRNSYNPDSDGEFRNRNLEVAKNE